MRTTACWSTLPDAGSPSGELFGLRDGGCLVVQSIKPTRGDGPPKLRLLPVNSAHEPYADLVPTRRSASSARPSWTLRRN